MEKGKEMMTREHVMLTLPLEIAEWFNKQENKAGLIRQLLENAHKARNLKNKTPEELDKLKEAYIKMKEAKQAFEVLNG